MYHHYAAAQAELRQDMLEAHRLIASKREIFEATAILKINGEARSEYSNNADKDPMP